jgi:hypothetical protein
MVTCLKSDKKVDAECAPYIILKCLPMDLVHNRELTSHSCIYTISPSGSILPDSNTWPCIPWQWSFVLWCWVHIHTCCFRYYLFIFGVFLFFFSSIKSKQSLTLLWYSVKFSVGLNGKNLLSKQDGWFTYFSNDL